MTAYVSVSIGGDDFGRVREIEAEIRAFPQILECYSVSGEDDYLLKVVAHDLKSLSNFLTDRLMQVPGIDDVRSMIASRKSSRRHRSRSATKSGPSGAGPSLSEGGERSGEGAALSRAHRVRGARALPYG